MFSLTLLLLLVVNSVNFHGIILYGLEVWEIFGFFGGVLVSCLGCFGEILGGILEA